MLRNEDDLKTLLISSLSSDFELVTEVNGENIIDGQRIRIDFLAKPKPFIADCGFIDEWFGIEVKYISTENIGSQINKVFWQAVSYSQSIFDIGKPPFLDKKRLPFVFVLINTQSMSQCDYEKRLSIVLSFCQYANVGQLILYPSGYFFKFGGGSYFKRYKGDIHKGLTNAGIRRYTGNAIASKNR